MCWCGCVRVGATLLVLVKAGECVVRGEGAVVWEVLL